MQLTDSPNRAEQFITGASARRAGSAFVRAYPVYSSFELIRHGRGFIVVISHANIFAGYLRAKG